jgi:hypothetical protein
MKTALKETTALAGLACALLAASIGGALAQAAAPPAAPAAPAAWADTLKLSGYADAGITFNTKSPDDGVNYGRLYDDRSNVPLLNQLSLAFERDLDPKATGYDFGFRFQGIYGSDARYTHLANVFDRTTNSRYQWDIIEADAQAHLPLLTEGGIDTKVGIFPTAVGYEVIAPSGNPLYSHSYIYNFGITVKHLGAQAITHVNSIFDLYLGVDTGNLTSFGRNGDNNGALAGLFGGNLTLMDGKLAILALTHIGPENPRGALDRNGNPINVNSAFRYYNDIVVTFKPSDTLTLVSDFDYVRDDGYSAQAYGFAQYATLALSDTLAIQLRGEVFRDANGFFVSANPGSLDFTNALRGPRVGTSNAYGVGGPGTGTGVIPATYSELTFGLNIKPAVPDRFTGLMIRPEIRYDSTLGGGSPYNDGRDNHSLTFAADLIVPFSIF